MKEHLEPFAVADVLSCPQTVQQQNNVFDWRVNDLRVYSVTYIYVLPSGVLYHRSMHCDGRHPGTTCVAEFKNITDHYHSMYNNVASSNNISDRECYVHVMLDIPLNDIVKAHLVPSA